MARTPARLIPIAFLCLSLFFSFAANVTADDDDDDRRGDYEWQEGKKDGTSLKLLWLLHKKVEHLEERVDDLESCACTEKPICGGESGLSCDEGGFCETAPGSCEVGGEGFCEAMPGICPDIWAPVCGCNGVSYPNDCARRAVGVSKASEGICEGDSIACANNSECAKGAFCATDPDSCGQAGSCAATPQLCPKDFKPVCGCDGKTYPNECFANQAGVSAGLPGSCRTTTCSVMDDVLCSEGESCFFKPGVCGDDAAGICVPTPQTCSDIYAPVCGCDENTYDNACKALVKGAGFARGGTCDGSGLQICGGETGMACDEGSLCRSKIGVCDEDALGICVEVPDVCDTRLDPVCGCDDVTYNNRCMALQAGAPIASDGACQSVEPEPRKVKVCHKPDKIRRTLTISRNAVPAHLRHGDTLGSCD